MSKVIDSIVSNFGSLRGVPEGAEAIFGVDLGGIISQLLEGILNTCLGSLNATEAAQVLREPNPLQQRQLKAAAMRKAKKAVPKSRSLRGRSLRRKRQAFAGDLIASMEQTAVDSTLSETVEFVKGVRA